MERGKRKKICCPSKGQTTPSAFHAKVPILPALPLVGFVPLQMAVIKLQRLYDKIRFLPSGDGFRYELGYPLVLKGRLLFLVWLFLLHDALDNLIREFSLLHELFHLDSLCKRGRGIVVAHRFKQGVLLPRKDRKFPPQGGKQSGVHLPFAGFRVQAPLDG